MIPFSLYFGRDEKKKEKKEDHDEILKVECQSTKKLQGKRDTYLKDFNKLHTRRAGHSVRKRETGRARQKQAQALSFAKRREKKSHGLSLASLLPSLPRPPSVYCAVVPHTSTILPINSSNNKSFTCAAATIAGATLMKAGNEMTRNKETFSSSR